MISVCIMAWGGGGGGGEGGGGGGGGGGMSLQSSNKKLQFGAVQFTGGLKYTNPKSESEKVLFKTATVRKWETCFFNTC